MNRELLFSIFRDAKIVDIDMSDWDRGIRLVVIATEATAFPAKRLPVYVVDLRQVKEFTVKFHHYDREPDFGHYQWCVDTIHLDETDDGLRLHLSQWGGMPETAIQFDDVDVRHLDSAMLDRCFPGWNEPGASFLRHGIEQAILEGSR